MGAFLRISKKDPISYRHRQTRKSPQNKGHLAVGQKGMEIAPRICALFPQTAPSPAEWPGCRDRWHPRISDRQSAQPGQSHPPTTARLPSTGWRLATSLTDSAIASTAADPSNLAKVLTPRTPYPEPTLRARVQTTRMLFNCRQPAFIDSSRAIEMSRWGFRILWPRILFSPTSLVPRMHNR
jgi:hypothetical protein